ncbi:MAG: DNA mismatch repair endonuclease MutL [Catenisphaera adipataccumulans]|jgi:DNA mismatch repair protein MutL|uniref:DNA mismatch repair endonuclease MutL n=1 Tax=Catenisphaera adipataccumulans TaxID=700500 RepID=UPI003D92314B
MAHIHVLSEQLTNMIAAGEVVDRPANIVKECVENSIDAQAQVIDIEVWQGGIERIMITDDGIGMSPEDADLSFCRHATSKIADEADLFNIQTMGFRGEAIPSIASVAHVDMKTNDGTTGTHIVYDYGEKKTKEEISCPKGTCIDVSGLFVKTPARFKHLKSPTYEFSIIADLVNKLALSHPEIRFTLSHNDRVIFQTSGNGNIQEILFQMYGREVAMNAIPFEKQKDEFTIKGYAVQPKINRATKYFLFVTLNTRLIRSNPIQHAILDAYSDFLPKQRYPICVLQITTDTQLVDVNVHPNKWEVRLSKQSQLTELIRETIKETLSAQLKTVEIKQINKQPVYQQPEMTYTYPVPKRQDRSAEIHKGFENYQSIPTAPDPIVQEEQEPIQSDIPEETNRGPEFFNHLTVLAQLHDSYILCSDEKGLVIIDQHAAQERYHYEQLLEQLDHPVMQTQPLLVPIQIDVPDTITAQVKEINEKTEFFGLHFEAFGDDQLILREVPNWFSEVDAIPFLQDLLDTFVKEQNVNMKSLRKKVIATMACHSSIRFNRPLSKAEMEKVIEDLRHCKQPYHCPHGRPTVITLSDEDLRKEFERG